jgi:hypothetical protein
MSSWLSCEDRRWASILRQTQHDFYHLPYYAQLAARWEGGRATAFCTSVANQSLIIPLVIRTIPESEGGGPRLFDAISPYGYAGPLVPAGVSETGIQDAFDRFVQSGRSQGLVTSFLRMHPLLGTRGGLLPLHNNAIQTVDHGFTVSVDLTLDEQTLDRKLRRDHRRSIRRLVANGFKARVDEWSDYPVFQKIYRDTMTRLGAADHYIFDESYFSNLRKCLGPSLHICTIIDSAGKVVSAGLFSVHGTISQYHLSGTVAASLSEAPSKLLVREMRNCAKRAGAKVFHLGGGVGAGRDSLFMFKHGFATEQHKFQTVRVVHDALMYAELKKRWLVERRRASFPDPAFFPLYRSAD